MLITQTIQQNQILTKQIYNQKAFEALMIYFLLRLRPIEGLIWWTLKQNMNYTARKRHMQDFENSVRKDYSESGLVEEYSPVKISNESEKEPVSHNLMILETEQTVKVSNNFETESDDELLLSMLIQKKWLSEYINSLTGLTTNQHGNPFLTLPEVRH